MVYKKYVKKKGRLHGPYYYESYRGDDGKVKKRYIGTSLPGESAEKKVVPQSLKIFLVIIGILFVLGVGGYLAYSNSDILMEKITGFAGEGLPTCHNYDLNGDGWVDGTDMGMATAANARTDCSCENTWCDRGDVNMDGLGYPAIQFYIENEIFQNPIGDGSACILRDVSCPSEGGDGGDGDGEETAPVLPQCWNPDVNGDGIINILDLTLVGMNYGKTEYCGYADVNRDGKVDDTDRYRVGSSVGDETGECRQETLDCNKILGVEIVITEEGNTIGEIITPEEFGALDCDKADVNGDTIVDEVDEKLVNDNFGKTDYCGYSDINEDGKIGLTDLTIVRDKFNNIVENCVQRELDCAVSGTAGDPESSSGGGGSVENVGETEGTESVEEDESIEEEELEVSGDCVLERAYWEVTEADEGQFVNLIVEGQSCNGQEIMFRIEEDDGLLQAFQENFIDFQPFVSRFSGDTAKTRWVSEYEDDFIGNPEFYFVASLASDSTTNVISKGFEAGILRVIDVDGKGEFGFAFRVLDEIIVNEDLVVEEDSTQSVETVQFGAVLGKPVQWEKRIKVDSAVEGTKLDVRLPELAGDIKVKKIEKETREEIEIDVEIINEKLIREVAPNKITSRGILIFAKIFRSFLGLTGRVADVLGEDGEVGVEIGNVSEQDEFVVEYFTDAPFAEEVEIDSKEKKVTIKGPDEIHYENVLAFSNLPSEVSDLEKIKIYWFVGETLKEVEFDAYDLNGNGLFDYVEWVVPELSEQVYEIIVITKATHLDSNREFMEDVYEKVREVDGVWATIPVGEYVRVTFERELDKTKDITVFAKSPFPGTGIQVFEENGEIQVANFDEIGGEGKEYKVYLSALIGKQDTFDLFVTGLNVSFVEIDYIVDPSADSTAPSVDFTKSTFTDGTVLTSKNVFVGLNTDDANDHYAFADVGGDIKMWMRMDDLDLDGNPIDLSGNNLDGTRTGVVVNSTFGYWGNGSNFDGVNDQIAIVDDNSLELTEFAVSAWFKTEDGGTIISNDGVGSVHVKTGWRVGVTEQGNLSFYMGQGEVPGFMIHETEGLGIADNEWHHVAVTYIAGGNSLVNIYLDGAIVKEITDASPIVYVDTGVPYIGRNNFGGGGYFKGSVDEVVVFGRALDLGEIGALYNASAIQYSKTHAISSSGTYDIKGHAIDLAGNRNETETRTVTLNLGSGGSPAPSVSPEECVSDWVCVPRGPCIYGERESYCADLGGCKGSKHLSSTCNVDPACVPNWVCPEWSDCVDGVSVRQCVDQNFCKIYSGGNLDIQVSECNDAQEEASKLKQELKMSSEGSGVRELVETGAGTCEPEVVCGEFGGCEYVGNVVNILKGELTQTGFQRRECKDTSDCIPSYVDERACVSDEEILLSPKEVCEVANLVALKGDGKSEVVHINLEQWKSIGKLDVLFLQNEIAYCDWCYNAVQDRDETGVDCGGEFCKPCQIEGIDEFKIVLLVLVWGLFVGLMVIFVKRYGEDYVKAVKKLRKKIK
tara:strand:- start:2640 stop:7142 length:4503 start_codon:yes stop_codon:yes gene_type:complete